MQSVPHGPKVCSFFILVSGTYVLTIHEMVLAHRPLLDIMTKNVKLNALEANVKVAELNW